MQPVSKDYIVELTGASDFLEGRITVTPMNDRYMAEVNLVLKESGKIYKNIKNIYDQYDEEEIVRLGVQALKNSLVRR